MFQLAVYGKGGIGKSTMSANISYSLARRGHRVMQIGCDPKHDSTRLLIGGGTQRTVLDYVRQVPEPERKLSDVAVEGSGGVICIESGGPEPGIGCAGRGILTAFDTVKRLGADSMGADIRLYDVLGDVVCGGFAVPLREENADGVIIVTSGEFMSLYAANNIMKGIRRFTPGRPRLIGLVLNSRGVEGEEEAVRRFADATGTRIIAVVPRDRLFASAEAAGHTVCEMYPDSEPAKAISGIVDRVEAVIAGADMYTATPLDDDQMSDLAAGREIRKSSRGASGPPVCDGCVMAPQRMRSRYSCSTCGAMIALARLGDAAVVIHGPRSCAYLMDSAYLSTVADLYLEGIYEHPMPDNIYSTCMDEGAAIFGGAESLERTLGEAAEDGFSRMVVLTTCVSGMIGDDCDAVARDFMSSNPGTEVRVMHLDGIIGGDYFDGMEDVVTSLIGMIDPAVPTVPGTVNLVGTTFFDLQTPEAVRELGRMLSLFGLEVNCRFLDETTLESIEGYCRGSVDIALNEAGAEETVRRIDEEKGRTAPMVRIPTGPHEYRGWLARMGEITGKTDVVERESRRSDSQYSEFIDEMRPLLEGRRIILSTCITRSVDWFMDMADDLGMEIVRLGYMKGEDELGNVTRTRRDMVEYFYGKDSMSRDIRSLEPDILIYDVDRPDDCPVPAVHMERIGPGLSSAFAFFREIAEALGVKR